MGRFGRHPRVRALSRELGLSDQGDCQVRIVAYALERVEGWLADTPVKSLPELRSALAAWLAVDLEFIRTDRDFGRIAHAEQGFPFPLEPWLRHHLDAGGAEGITLRRSGSEPGDRCYLAVVDGRGDKASRAYFTAWHEMAHALLGPEAGARISRVDDPAHPGEDRDPIESVVDEVAARLAFYEPLFRPVVDFCLAPAEPLSFAAMDRIRAVAAPEASLYATAIATVRLLDMPVCLVRAQWADGGAEKALALDQITWSRAAWSRPVPFGPGLRVPSASVLYQVWGTGAPAESQALEDVRWWGDSPRSAPDAPMRVSAVSRAHFVYGLIQP